MIWAGARTLACTISEANPSLIACRFGTRYGLPQNTPNMGGYYVDNVFPINGKT